MSFAKFGNDKAKHGKHAKHAKQPEPAHALPEVEEEKIADKPVSLEETVELEAVSTEPETKAEATSDAEFGGDVDFDSLAQNAGEAVSPAVATQEFPAPTFDGAAKKKMSKQDLAKKVLSIIGATVLALILVAYGVGVFYFSDRFFPNTKLNDTDISMKAQSDLERMLDNHTKDYALRVKAEDFNLSITASQAGFQFDSKQQAEKFLSSVNAWLWPIEVFMSHDVSADLEATIDEKSVDTLVHEAVAKHNETARPTENATIGYDKAKGGIAVIPEKYGTKIEEAVASKTIKDAIKRVERSLTLSNSDLEQPKIFSDDKRLAEAAEKANEMLKADITLKLGDIEASHITSEVSIKWVKLGDDFSVTFDKEAMEKWAEELATSFDTIGSTRQWTRPDGKECEVSGGDYGWEVDHEALISLITTNMEKGVKVTESVPTSSQGVAYNGAGKKDWGNRYVDLDLSEQHVRFYDANNDIIWESDCITGSPGKNATPTGVYDLNGKESPSKLIGYENGKKIYETMVRKWMPFIGNGIGFHDADWQPGFGGQMYRQGYGSHGCCNLPVDMAASLYEIIEVGDVVVVHW